MESVTRRRWIAVPSTAYENQQQRDIGVSSRAGLLSKGLHAPSLPTRLPCVGGTASLQEWEGGAGEVQLEQAPQKGCGNAKIREMTRDTSLRAS